MAVLWTSGIIFLLTLPFCQPCRSQCSRVNNYKDYFCLVTRDNRHCLNPPADTEGLTVEYAYEPIDITQEAFISYKQLKRLTITGSIGTIYPGAFGNIPPVTINITRATIYAISSRAFYGLKELKELKIERTSINIIHPNAIVADNLIDFTITEVNTTNITSHSFHLEDVERITLNTMFVHRLSNAAFINSKRIGVLSVNQIQAKCIGVFAFTGITKINTAHFTRNILPHTPLLSPQNVACDNCYGFECLGESFKMNKTLLTDTLSPVRCRPSSTNEWVFAQTTVHNLHESHIRYSIGFICGGLFVIALCIFYVGNHAVGCKTGRPFLRHQRRIFSATNVQGRAQRPGSSQVPVEEPALQSSPSVHLGAGIVNSSHLPPHRIFYTETAALSLPPSYEDSQKTPALPITTIIATPSTSPPPPYSAPIHDEDELY